MTTSTTATTSSIEATATATATIEGALTPTSQTITITLEDGSAGYVIRGLREKEIGAWANFCASVFSYKANAPPASYFEQHYHNDPDRQAELVRVVVTADTNTIVSSCRIFRKNISLGLRSGIKEDQIQTLICAGGIGEVCTSLQHRRRGLSRMLLHDAIRIMKEDCNMQVSVLHAAPEFSTVYKRGGGYANTVSKWSVVTLLQVDKLTATSTVTRLAQFPRDTKQLQALHHEYSERRFAGCIVRSEQYWNEYLSKELDGTLYVLEHEEAIVAWMSLRRRGDRFQMREFGFDDSTTTSSCSCQVDQAVVQLLVACLAQFGLSSLSAVDLHLPTFVLDFIGGNDCTFVQVDSIREENDLGWMYVALQDKAIDMVEVNNTVPHLIWPADSF